MNLEDPGSFRDFRTEPAVRSADGDRRIMKGVADYSRRVGWLLLQEIKSESRSIAIGQLNVATRKLDNFSEALREAAGKLREKHSYTLADVMETGSEGMMRVSDSLRGSSPEKIIDEVKDFARRRPGIFLGAVVAAGIVLGQLFASPREREGRVQEVGARRESSIEYRPGRDEEEYYERQ